jgi:hypothetical protein
MLFGSANENPKRSSKNQIEPIDPTTKISTINEVVVIFIPPHRIALLNLKFILSTHKNFFFIKAIFILIDFE